VGTFRAVLVEESIEIARAPDEVWSFVADPSNDPRWCPKVKDVTASGERRWTVLHKPVPLRPPAELTIEQLELDTPQRLLMRQEDDASVFRVEYRLERTATGPRCSQFSDFEWKKLPRILHGTFGRGVRRDVRRQLRELKRVLESG
jgi:uncharacterized protein YndB with AHSA1/START domain